MTATKYFTLMNNSFKKYNVDAALKKANYDVTRMAEVDPIKVLDILQKSFGQRGFYTCDNETKGNWSTVSICLSPLPPYKITKCPANLLKPNTKCKSGKLKINTEHGGPVSRVSSYISIKIVRFFC
jgi:Ribonuclease T2 family